MKFAGFLLVSLGLIFGGCSSYSTHIEPNKKVTQYQRFWVRRNMDDNHAVEQMIIQSLRKRGFQAEGGYETMMPRDYQVLVTFRDHWTWDFTDHMSGLQLTLSDIRKETPIAAVTFVGPLALLSSPPAVVDQLVDELLKAKPKKMPERSDLDVPDPTKPEAKAK